MSWLQDGSDAERERIEVEGVIQRRGEEIESLESKLSAMTAERDELKRAADVRMTGLRKQADIERARAQAFSSAADTACNQWNCLDRSEAWCAMTGYFQLIWKNLKNISDDYHKIADEMDSNSTDEGR